MKAVYGNTHCILARKLSFRLRFRLRLGLGLRLRLGLRCRLGRWLWEILLQQRGGGVRGWVGVSVVVRCRSSDVLQDVAGMLLDLLRLGLGSGLIIDLGLIIDDW